MRELAELFVAILVVGVLIVTIPILVAVVTVIASGVLLVIAYNLLKE